MDAFAFIDYISDLISNFKTKDLMTELKGLKIDSTDENSLITFLGIILNIAQSVDNKEAMSLILKIFNLYDDDDLNLYSRLFRSSTITNQTLRWIAESVKEYTFVETIWNMIQHTDASDQTAVMINRVFKIYPFRVPDELRELVRRAKEMGHQLAETILLQNLQNQLQLIPGKNYQKPNHILDQHISIEEIQKIVQEKTCQQFKVEPSQLTDFLIGGFQNYGLVFDVSQRKKNKIEDLLKDKSSAEIREFFEEVSLQIHRQRLSEDIELFRIFGPANPLVGEDFRIENLSTIYGGSRMFLSNELEIDSETDEIEDWFKSVCQSCHRYIQHDYEAVRLPVPDGAWRGCYCSWECVIHDTDF